MSMTKTEEKLKNLEGMKGAIEGIVAQAWERGYKYGLYEAKQKNQVKVLIGGEQVYPERDWQSEMAKDYQTYTSIRNDVGGRE